MVKKDNQTILFDYIQKVLPANLTMVDVISDLLGASTDAAYRRIRGAKPLDFEEAIILCKHFNISLDLFSQENEDKNQIRCGYIPLDLKDLHNHVLYLQNLLADIEAVRMADPIGEMIVSAATLPTFSYLPYNELTFFKLFSWSNSVYNFSGKYEDFVKDLDINDLLPCYQKIVKSYQNVPSTEIWTTGAIDRILTLLNHHHEMGHFNDENLPLLLCEQILDLINTLQDWTEKAAKGKNEVPYKFYVSEIEFNNSFILFKTEKMAKCFLKLFTINGLRTTDEFFCRELENWLENTEQRAILISGASEKERYKFFSGLKQKVRVLIDKIYQSNLREWSRGNKSVSF